MNPSLETPSRPVVKSSLLQKAPHVMRPAISQVCTLGSSLEDDIDGYANAQGGAIEFWLTKLEEYLKTHTVAEVKALTADRELAIAAASFQGGILVAQGEGRRVAWDQFLARLDLCAEIGIPVLVVLPDFQGPFSEQDIERAQVSLKQAGQAAAKRGVRLAIEFAAKNTFINNLETAAYFIQSVQEPSVGICLDAFHFFIGPSKLEDLGHLTRENLFHVQVCDVADRPRELASDADRIMPGDGDFRLTAIFDRLRQINYDRFVSLELHNPQLWQIPAKNVGEIGMTALRIALGTARNS